MRPMSGKSLRASSCFRFLLHPVESWGREEEVRQAGNDMKSATMQLWAAFEVRLQQQQQQHLKKLILGHT